MNIVFDNVSFRYVKNENTLKNINLSFDKSEIVFLMGHTGSGKSTLVQHINGLLMCDEGEVRVNFNDNNFILSKKDKPKNINDLRKEIGMVFQFPEYQLFETSVLRDVMFGPYNFYKEEKVAKQMAKDALEKMGIKDSYYKKSPFDLSGGEKRKVAIAGVLASNPSVLVLDEPTSSLDPAATKEVMELIKSLKEDGKLVIVISHDTDLCYEYADRVIIMEDGEVVKDCKVDEAFKDQQLLDRTGLMKPFVYKIKNVMKIKDESVRSVDNLKEVILNV